MDRQKGAANRIAKGAVVVLLAMVSSGCYHATVRTGMEPTSAERHTRWAHSWIYGLVPPAQVDATAVCNGRPASQVSTQVSAANGLVQWLTFGIYSPMTIEVTCAQNRAGESEDS